MIGYDLFFLFIKKDGGGEEWHTVFIHTAMKIRKLRTIPLENQISVLVNTLMSGESLSDCMDKINNICTFNSSFYSN